MLQYLILQLLSLVEIQLCRKSIPEIDVCKEQKIMVIEFIIMPGVTFSKARTKRKERRKCAQR